MYRWIKAAEELRPKSKKPNPPNPKTVPPTGAFDYDGAHCYYCDSDGDHVTACCPDKAAGKQPCEKFKKYVKETYGHDYVPRKGNKKQYHKKKRNVPNASFVASLLNSDSRREVAVTSDLNFKGKDRWFNGEEALLDSCGCDTLVDDAFARFHLRLPIHKDTSDSAQQTSSGVGGNKFQFTHYIIMRTNFLGKVRNVKD